LNNYKEAIDAYDNLKKADNPIIEIRDTMASATSLVGIKKYDEAMVLYDKVLRKPNISSRDLEATNIYINQCMAARIKDYTSNGNYQQAIDMYKSFLDKREAENLVTDDMRMNYANIYMDWADELNGPEKIEKLMESFFQQCKNLTIMRNL
jgi:tetratricopeptide (TPR) repeat protein